jgi:hypothetical protein
VGNVVDEWPDIAAGLAARGFDLDYIGPEIAEQLATELAFLVGELQDSETCERTGQRFKVAHWSISSI